jgi:hypothetical protein
MRRAGMLLSLLLFVLLLAGCSAMFDFNLFKDLGLDPVAAPTPADYAGAGGLDKLADDLSSPAVVDALKADPAAAAALETFLEGLITGGVDTPEEQQAAILLADLELKSTEGEEFVNNIVNVVVQGVSGTSSIQDLLNSTIPPEALASAATYAAMVNGLLDANEAYLALGAGILDINGTPGIQQGEGVPPGTNMGDIAQKAIVAFTTKVIFEAVQAAGPFSDADTITQMYLLSTNPTAADPAVQALAAPDPFDPASPDLYIQANLPTIEKIVDCAGLALPGA